MTPCVGPYLALILNLLLNEDLASGAFLLLAYALGLIRWEAQLTSIAGPSRRGPAKVCTGLR